MIPGQLALQCLWRSPSPYSVGGAFASCVGGLRAGIRNTVQSCCAVGGPDPYICGRIGGMMFPSANTGGRHL